MKSSDTVLKLKCLQIVFGLLTNLLQTFQNHYALGGNMTYNFKCCYIYTGCVIIHVKYFKALSLGIK